jgi:hypothetical protein
MSLALVEETTLASLSRFAIVLVPINFSVKLRRRPMPPLDGTALPKARERVIES